MPSRAYNPVPMKLAILLTNNDTAAFAARYPNDGEKFRTLFAALRPGWSIDVFAVKDGIFPPRASDFQGYVITGSPASVNDPLPWIAQLLDFLRDAHERRRALLGICFGHQALAAALGGKVEAASQGWGLGISRSVYTYCVPWMNLSAPTSQMLIAAHCDQVTKLPRDAINLCSSPHCAHGGFAIGKHVFTSQFHPEMTPAFMGDLLDFLRDKLPEPTLREARNTLREPGALSQVSTDAARFLGWAVRFFEQAANGEEAA